MDEQDRELENEPTDEQLRAKLEWVRSQIISCRGTLDPMMQTVEGLSALTGETKIPGPEGLTLYPKGELVVMDPETAAWHARTQAENQRTARRKMGLPDDYLNGRLGFHTWPARTANERDALDRMRAWVAGTGERKSLLLTGNVGTGKSGLVMSALASLAKTHPPQHIRVYSSVEMANIIRVVFSSDVPGDSEAAAVARFAVVPFLALDDLDKGSVSPWWLKTLWDLVNERERHGLPTIFTANAIDGTDPLKSLVRRFSVPGMGTDAESVVDRIRGMSVHIHLTGTSHRGRNRSLGGQREHMETAPDQPKAID